MNVLFTILTVLVLLASALLTLIVLLQNGKGGGLASNFVAGNQTFGVRKTADFLEKATWYLAIGIVVLSLLATVAMSSHKKANTPASDAVIEQIMGAAEEAPVMPNQVETPAE